MIPDGISRRMVFLPPMMSVDQSQNGLLAADDERVASVVAALEPHHAFCMIGKPIDDFPFAFVTPLGSDHDDIASLAYCGCGHVELVRRLKTYSTLVAGRFPVFTAPPDRRLPSFPGDHRPPRAANVI